MVRHTEAADEEPETTEYDIVTDHATRADFADVTEGDAIDVVYEPKRGKRASKTVSGVVTHVARRDDGEVTKINADTGDEYDEGTPKTFEFEPTNVGGGYVRSHGKTRKTSLGNPTRVIVRTFVDDDGDDEDDRCIDPDDVDFDPHVIAAAWEAFDDGVPVPVAVAITNEFTDHRVAAYDGEAVDRDVVFGADESNPTGDIHFEEKAVGVCPRDVAEEHAPAFVDLPNRDDGYVLAVNPAQIFG